MATAKLELQASLSHSHPRGIYHLFLTELWERFSYYGITALLILYMSETFGVSNAKVYAIYGAYGALVYTTPIIGGYLADKFWSPYRPIVYGALLITLGHFVVGIPDPEFRWFYLGLALILVGTGLFKPNIATIIGQLYQNQQHKRDAGFTLAYMGSNIGTIIAPIVCAYVAVKYSWSLAFSLAGVGMLIGLLTFVLGSKHYVKASCLNGQGQAPSHENKLLLLAFALVLLVYLALQWHQVIGSLLVLVTIGILLWVLRLMANTHPAQRGKIIVALILTGFYVMYMILLQQSGGALNLFTEANVDRYVVGWQIPTGMFQSVEPLALVLLAPFYNVLWDKLAQRKIVLSDAVKFSLALVIMGLSFALLAFAMGLASADAMISMWWINAVYVLQAASELFIGPIGLAMVSRLIPANMVGLFMGIWLLARAIANFAAANIGAWITPVSDSIDLIDSYVHAFQALALFGVAAGLLLLMVKKTINRLLNDSE